MKTLLIATCIFTGSFALQGAVAQSAIDRLKDSQDMSTGLPKDPPPRADGPRQFETPADRANERLKDSQDMSTGLAKDAPPTNNVQRSFETPTDRANERLKDSQDMSTGLPRR